MKPVYLDLHIHTSENPNKLNENYNSDVLLSKISEVAKGANFLISLTDHNVINEKAYIDLLGKIQTNYPNSSLILGAELHIRKYKEDENAKAYHCHIFFDVDDITQEVIKDINSKLNTLYKKKVPENKDSDIPLLEQVLDAFDGYDFLLLPHGGQTHSTFHNTIRSATEEKNFDNTLYRSLYYNFFDGFTSRSNKGIEDTKKYFEKMGIEQFVGLITASDNYNPTKYPSPRSTETNKFIPTWMYASPSFDGLRIALSDPTRLVYSHDKPKQWENTIEQVCLENENIKIDVKFTAGLNVIIGGSSSGKTLLIDSIVRKLYNKTFNKKDDKTSVYNERYSVEEINVLCPTKVRPYYIHQNYISEIINTHGQITEIEPLNNLFPDTKDQRKRLSIVLAELKDKITKLFGIVEEIEKLEIGISKIPVLHLLITTAQTKDNPVNILLQIADRVDNELYYDAVDYNKEKDILTDIHQRLKKHPIVDHSEEAYQTLLKGLKSIREYFVIHEQVYGFIKENKSNIDHKLEEQLGKEQEKKRKFDELINKMGIYYKLLSDFEDLILEIASFNKTHNTPSRDINGHKLFFEGSIKVNSEVIKESFNKYLLSGKKIQDFKTIKPKDLFAGNFNKNQPSNPTGAKPQYSLIANNVYNSISEQNQIRPKILTKTKEDFSELSPGKQTAVILDLVLNYDADSAPIIIDQPEDNLSSEYMNTELVELIKRKKHKKQIIFVSHNATIPMIGDAQNIILCQNNDGKITIRSAPLEGKIDDIKIVDYIAEITDGGKQSVKKRFKKYNLKRFKK